MEITFEPLQDKGNSSICRVFLNGKYAFNQWTFYPNRYDFKKEIRNNHLLDGYFQDKKEIKKALKELNIKDYSIEENGYAEEFWWVWIRDLDDAIKFFLKFDVDFQKNSVKV